MFTRLHISQLVNRDDLVYKNPSPAELEVALHKTRFPEVRFMSIEKDVYIWPADKALHSDIKQGLGLGGVYQDPRCNYYGWIIDRKGHYEIGGNGLNAGLMNSDSIFKRMLGNAKVVVKDPFNMSDEELENAELGLHSASSMVQDYQNECGYPVRVYRNMSLQAFMNLAMSRQGGRLRGLILDPDILWWDGLKGTHAEVSHMVGEFNGMGVEARPSGNIVLLRKDVWYTGTNERIAANPYIKMWLASGKVQMVNSFKESKKAKVEETKFGKILSNPSSAQVKAIIDRKPGLKGAYSIWRVLKDLETNSWYFWDANLDGAIHSFVANELGLTNCKGMEINSFNLSKINYNLREISETWLTSIRNAKGPAFPLRKMISRIYISSEAPHVEDTELGRVFVNPTKDQLRAFAKRDIEAYRYILKGSDCYLWDANLGWHTAFARALAIRTPFKVGEFAPKELEDNNFDVDEVDQKNY